MTPSVISAGALLSELRSIRMFTAHVPQAESLYRLRSKS